MSKTQKPKALNSNNFSCFDPRVNIEIFNKAWKEKKKYWRQKKYDKKVSNPDILGSRVNITIILMGKNIFKQISIKLLIGTAIKRTFIQKKARVFKVKKQVTILATSTSLTKASIEAIPLQQVLYI